MLEDIWRFTLLGSFRAQQGVISNRYLLGHWNGFQQVPG
jgi:hypothetical protein